VPVSRVVKAAQVADVKSRLAASSGVLLADYRGLSVAQISTLRRSLRPSQSELKVYKNTLIRRAVAGTPVEEMQELLVGPTVVAFVRDDLAEAARILRDFSRANPGLTVKGGALGHRVISAGDAMALADLPSREVLLARLAGGLAAPMRNLASLMQALPRNFAYGLAELIRQREAA
jgi:large subunit ribosomal protein L10